MCSYVCVSQPSANCYRQLIRSRNTDWSDKIYVGFVHMLNEEIIYERFVCKSVLENWNEKISIFARCFRNTYPFFYVLNHNQERKRGILSVFQRTRNTVCHYSYSSRGFRNSQWRENLMSRITTLQKKEKYETSPRIIRLPGWCVRSEPRVRPHVPRPTIEWYLLLTGN